MGFSVEGLAIGFGGVAIQRDLGFALDAGKRIALWGPSGCGKSTALRALAMLDLPIAGTVTLDGRSPEQHGYPAWRRRVVHVAQRAFFFGAPVIEELARPFSYRSADRAFDARAADEALERVGLAGKRDAPIDELSEGERQRVALVRAVLLAPRVLLLDEPTSALDGATIARVEAWLDETAASIVLVTHDEAQRERFCGDILELGAIDA